jgi:hypothetical protein
VPAGSSAHTGKAAASTSGRIHRRIRNDASESRAVRPPEPPLFASPCQLEARGASYNDRVRYFPLLLVAACAANGRIELTREVDGAWVHTFEGATTEQAYHAAMATLSAKGWAVVRADPLGGSVTMKSPVDEGMIDVWYRLAHVVVEPGPSGGARVRLGLVCTREYAGGGREPNNDRTVSDREDYEEIFLAIRQEIAG